MWLPPHVKESGLHIYKHHQFGTYKYSNCMSWHKTNSYTFLRRILLLRFLCFFLLYNHTWAECRDVQALFLSSCSKVCVQSYISWSWDADVFSAHDSSPCLMVLTLDTFVVCKSQWKQPSLQLSGSQTFFFRHQEQSWHYGIVLHPSRGLTDSLFMCPEENR